MDPITITPALDVHTTVLMLIRWVHFIAGITWIGLLYYFNFINGPFQKSLDAAAKRQVIPALMSRALWWFRWGAMFTLLSGIGYVVWKNWIASDAGFSGPGGLMTSTWGQWITLGGTLGIIMWFNVWFIIWPAQKKIIAWVKAGESPAEMPGLGRRALLASRTNTYLSLPLLFCMGAASHFPAMNPGLIVGVIVVGFAVVYGFIQLSTKVA